MDEKIGTNEKIATSTAFICGILCHLFMLTNKILNMDEVRAYVGLGGGLSLGRPLTTVIASMRGDISTPNVNCIIALIILAISAGSINKLFCVKSNISSCLLGVTMVVFPTVASSS